MNLNKIIYWIATGLFTVLMLFSVSNYFFNNATIREAFTGFGYPTYIISPLAIAKLLGLVAILSRKSELLKEWAYAGFFYNVVLAFFAHVMINDNQQWGALAAMVLLLTSYFFQRRAFAND